MIMKDATLNLQFEPEFWMVVFHDKADTPWVNRWLPSKLKHVDVVGYAPKAGVWIWVEVMIGRMVVAAVKDDNAGREMVALHRKNSRTLLVRPKVCGRKVRIPLNCVTAVAHLVGSRSGALLPDRLWRDLLAEGAQEI